MTGERQQRGLVPPRVEADSWVQVRRVRLESEEKVSQPSQDCLSPLYRGVLPPGGQSRFL